MLIYKLRGYTPIVLLRSYFENKYRSSLFTMSSDSKSDNHNTWRGVPITEIAGSQSPWGAPEFPLVSPGHNHAVLYHIPSSGNLVGDRPPKPQIGKDLWDSEHVRLPYSSHSLYPVENSNHEIHLKKRWEIIEEALRKPIHNSEELASTILSYNTKFKTVWKFQALHKLFDEYLEEEESQYFFDVTLPEIAKLALSLPKLIQAPIPLLKQHKNYSVSLSQQQISSLLANAFFCTFPRRNAAKRTSEYVNYPHINFIRLYEMGPSDDVMEKLKCLCHYFRRVSTKAPVGVCTFSRRSVPSRRCPQWTASTTQLSHLPLHVDSLHTIEDADGLVQVDFANKYLGGGVLGHGCVQEEIRFVICPELMISMLFCETMRPNEAIMMIGCERYSTYSGYGYTFHWTGDYIDCAPFDSSQRRRVAVLAIDALPYSSVRQEFSEEAITRELNKAWVGFSFGTDPASNALQYPGIATGNWGCGAFGGSPGLKSLIQMMACAEANRPMAYYTFKDNEIRDDVIGVYNLLARYNVTVGQLFRYIARFARSDVRYGDLHAFLHQVLRDGDEHPRAAPNPTPTPVPQEKMETSTSPEPSKLDISTALKDNQDSPEVFSQGEMNELTEIKIHKTDSPEPAASKHAAKQPHPSRLFEEMQRLDEQSGRLNLSVPNASPLKPTSNLSINNADASMDTSHVHSDATTKKKIRKITDYFSKKPV